MEINRIKCCYKGQEVLYENITDFKQDIKKFKNSHISIKYIKANSMLSVEFISINQDCLATLTYQEGSPVNFDNINKLAAIPFD